MHHARFASALLAVAGFVGTAQATTVNISGTIDPSKSSTGAATSQDFAAGTYDISVFDNSGAAGGFNGWTFATPVAGQAKPYREAFTFTVGGVSTTYDVSSGGPTGYYMDYASTADALAAFGAGPYAKLSGGTYLGSVSKMQLVLASDTTVLFSVPDNAGAFGDNTGGVSLAITSAATSVPEPASCALALAGLGALGWTRRRQKSL